MDDFDFHQIAPRCGGEREAFEELCCQLARRKVPEHAAFTRLRGAGGDGGVECFADMPDGNRIGWQAKYVFDVDSLIRQVTKSLSAALRIHSSLTHYTVCFPFDLTGPTGRRGRSGQEKFDEWRKKHEEATAAGGRPLKIDAWPASRLRSLLLDLDTAGGIRAFFFNDTILTNDWFSAHLNSARELAGPRYTPELNVETDLSGWFAAFGRTATWCRALEERVRPCREMHQRIACAVGRSSADSPSPAWPDDLREDAQSSVDAMENALNECGGLATDRDSQAHVRCVGHLDGLLKGLSALELRLKEDIETRHGSGLADSPGWRQFMAEYMVSFPTANLDDVRDAISACRKLFDWLQSPLGSLAFERVFVLTGAAGVGKTHGVCDVAFHRFREGHLACVTFGHAFGGEPDPWTRLSESLRLPIALGMDGVLDALNSAAEACGSPLMLCVDAINETRPLRYWQDRLSAVTQSVQRRPFLLFCVTCRTSFLPYCLPAHQPFRLVEHVGFRGAERDACVTFFRHYGLDPPVTPILQPELSNPLYLRLVCETLRARGFNRLPAGWYGLAPAIRAFLDDKERQFANEYETSTGAHIVTGSLKAIARAIADSGVTSLAWSKAQRAVTDAKPAARSLPVLEWLVRSDLIIEDAPDPEDQLGDESVVRPAFERLGDFLIADEILARMPPAELNAACKPGGVIYYLLEDAESVGRNSGAVSALSILIPEKTPGNELPDLVDDGAVRTAVLEVTLQSFPWRAPDSFSSSSVFLIREGLALEGLSRIAMDAVLSISWQPSCIDALWIDDVLKQQSLAKRDSFWCWYLHESYESSGPVRRLIEASFELPLDRIEEGIGDRWATMLLWFAAAADRRVKDRATRAVVCLLSARPEVIPRILTRLLDCDDDEVRERVLLSCYGAMIASRNTSVLSTVTSTLDEAFEHDPTAFDNALIRDHIRCILELARELDVLPDDCDPERTMRPIRSEWALDVPSESAVENLRDLPNLYHSCLQDDFFTYSMNCLRPWNHAAPKEDMGKWILQRVARGLGYQGSGCEHYDRSMLAKYGSGRGRKKWADRIGKKYQWLALYEMASRLSNRVERKRGCLRPEPLRTPLILLEERKIDPTLPANIVGHESHAGGWWIASSADLRCDDRLSDPEWVMSETGLPSSKDLLAPVERNGRRWRLLVSFPSWGNQEEGANGNEPYRHVWTHVQSYLIPEDEVATAYQSLHRRNLFGRRMPEGATWSYGFAGEYPWATPFNTEPEEWYGMGGHGINLPTSWIPSWCHLAVEWEYDASLPRDFHMILPARRFFAARDLWWNGRDGYQLSEGRTVFRDPSITEVGTAALVVDDDDLLERLDKLGVRLIWTLLGEKMILGGRHDEPLPRLTFSQIVRLGDDGLLVIGDRVFFEDCNQDTGPKVAEDV